MNIAGKSLEQWKETYPLIEEILELRESLWKNQQKGNASYNGTLTMQDIREAKGVKR